MSGTIWYVGDKVDFHTSDGKYYQGYITRVDRDDDWIDVEVQIVDLFQTFRVRSRDLTRIAEDWDDAWE